GPAAARRDQAARSGAPLLRGLDLGASADRHPGRRPAQGRGPAPPLPQAPRLRRAALPLTFSLPVPGRGVAQRPGGNAPVTRARAAACLAGPPPPRRRSAPTTLPVPGREIYFF